MTLRQFARRCVGLRGRRVERQRPVVPGRIVEDDVLEELHGLTHGLRSGQPAPSQLAARLKRREDLLLRTGLTAGE